MIEMNCTEKIALLKEEYDGVIENSLKQKVLGKRAY